MTEKTRHIQNPPALTAVHRAVLQVMAEYGPRRVPRVQVAERAGTDRQFLRRNWPDRARLHHDAVANELRRLLSVASELADFSDNPTDACFSIRVIVRAARMVREHPVTRATARTAPDLLRSAFLHTDTGLHGVAWEWFQRLPVARRAPFDRDVLALTQLLFTVSLPYALTPDDVPIAGEETRKELDSRLDSALHMFLRRTPRCPACAPDRLA
ncbi:hypothetical protein [Streptomyces beihaiensis]|uniref:TetR family transcriptional regulator n=1 Tax=Streptomyces beihaiensis TaxID=2984495 RepID=A0ABT3TUQ6_9ACTN|nr:hypothetical protein [Streptomyces beihaiensis]MCX3060767.1 hypothetical protein [Streptomyces beihaiensis]